MSLIFCDGFDQYQSGRVGAFDDAAAFYYERFAVVSRTAISARTGEASMGIGTQTVQGQECYLGRSFDGGQHFASGFAFYSNGAWYSGDVARLRLDGSSFELRIYDNVPRLYQGSTERVRNENVSIAPFTWHYFEIEYRAAAFGGVVAVYYEGALIMEWRHSLTVDCVGFEFRHKGVGVGDDGYLYVDDWYCIRCDDGIFPNRPLGPVKMVTAQMTADTPIADWSGLIPGPLFNNVQYPLTNDGNIVAALIGDQIEFKIAQASNDVAAIYGATLYVSHEKTDTGAAEYFGYLRIGENAVTTETLIPALTESFSRHSFSAFPTPSGFLSRDDFNIMFLGFERTV